MYIYLMKYRPIIIIVLNYHLTWSSNHVSCTVLTARSIKAWSPVMNSHSVMPKLTNQKLRKVSSWLLIGLNLHERMWINQKPSHFCTPCCNVCSWTKGLMILALLCAPKRLHAGKLAWKLLLNLEFVSDHNVGVVAEGNNVV